MKAGSVTHLPAVWSADHRQTTGQALVTARVVGRGGKWREYVYRGIGLRSVPSWCVGWLRLWIAAASNRLPTLYLVCSRSDGGFLRDVPALLCAFAGVRVVVHVHGSDITGLLLTKRPLSRLARALYARCEIVVPSAHLVEDLRAIKGATVHLCENFDPAIPAAGISASDGSVLTLCWNSNMMASKGFFDVAEAAKSAIAEGCSLRLVSIGSPIGDEELSRAGICARLASLRQNDWFDYRGILDPAAAAGLVATADVVALPSRYSAECQPLALIQAMCAGKEVVATDTPSLRATLGDYPARYVAPHCIAVLAAAFAALAREKAADPVGFAARNMPAAMVARQRFAADRFDRDIEAILGAPGDRA